MRAVDQVEARLARLIDIARHQLEPELRRQAEVGVVHLADDLAAHLQRAAVVELDALDAPADPLPRLHQQHVGARAGEIPCAGEPGQAATDDEDVATFHRRHASAGC